MLNQDRLNWQLIRAASEGDVKALSQALDGGADAKTNGSEALKNAAENDHVECVKLLIEVSDASAGDCYALRWAVSEGFIECVKLLLPVSGDLALKGGVLSFSSLARDNGHMEVAGMIEAFMEAKELSKTTQRAKPGPRVKSAL